MPKTAPGGLTANESQPIRQYFRLYKVTIPVVNTILRYIETDMDFTVDAGDGLGPQVWHNAPGITRGNAQQRIDLQIDTMSVSLSNSEIAIGSLGTQKITKWATLGIFDNARVDFFVWDLASNTVMWHSTWYVQGNPGWSYDEVTFTLEGQWGRFDHQSPLTIIQEACNNKLGDPYCGIDLTNFQATATIAASPAPTRQAFTVAITSQAAGVPSPIPDHWTDLGLVQFTSGALSVVRRMVYQQVGLGITLAQTLPFAPAIGDALILQAGCDKTAATCQSRFNNLLNFRGFPYVPAAQDIYNV